MNGKKFEWKRELKWGREICLPPEISPKRSGQSRWRRTLERSEEQWVITALLDALSCPSEWGFFHSHPRHKLYLGVNGSPGGRCLYMRNLFQCCPLLSFLALKKILRIFWHYDSYFWLGLVHSNLQSLNLQAAIFNPPIHWGSELSVACHCWGAEMWHSREKAELRGRTPGKGDFSRGKNKQEPISILRSYRLVDTEDTTSLG